MTERVIVRQNSDFEIEFEALDPNKGESAQIRPVLKIHELTPYTMMLASLGACTAIVLHTYAQNHDINLQEVELDLRYQRVFQHDCENCEDIERYDEQIEQTLSLTGDLKDNQRQKLFRVSQQCSVHKILESGIEIRSELSS